jgi:hypothetical protein
MPRDERKLFNWYAKKFITSLNLFLGSVTLSRLVVLANVTVKWILLILHVLDVHGSKLS